MKRSIRNHKPMGFFALLAAVLGIAGCKGAGDDVLCMYGVPTMSYELKGKVTDVAGKPVEGIEVTFERIYGADSTAVHAPLGPAVSTDAEGLWSASFHDDPTSVLKVTFRDVDGQEQGGLFAGTASVLQDLEPVKDPKDNKNPFDYGTVKLELPVVKLEKKKEP